MSKINPTSFSTSSSKERLAGGAGQIAAQESEILLLRRAVLANLLWEDVAYMDGESVANEIRRLIPLCDPEKVYHLTLEARLLQKLRHTPLFLASEMCKYEGTRKYVAKLLPQIITRADMLTDFLAIYWKDGKRPLANAAKKGLAESFHNFNEYKFAKYDRDAAIKLRDVLFLTHPKARNEAEEELFKKIAERNLATPDTWEVALSRGDDKKATWTRLIQEGKIGGKAMLMNIANMRKAEVERNTIEHGLKNLNGTMLLPLDFLKAARMNNEFERNIEEAMINSYKKLPKLPGKTLFIVDVSGSMGSLTSGCSYFSRLDQACAMAMLAANQCEDYRIVTTAGNDCARIGAHEEIKYPKQGFGLANQIAETKNRVGHGGIFTRQCLEWCAKHFEGETFERIIIFSDSQDCDYGNAKLPNPFGHHNYICDISANTKGVNYKGVWDAEISGWSEHFLTYIAALEGIENTFEE